MLFMLYSSYKMEEDCKMFKIVVIGTSGTGKTNIATRYIRDEYNDGSRATIGVQFLWKMVTIDDIKIKVTLWDTAGQQQYKSLGKVYYKGASGVLIVYDVTDPKSYLDVQAWMRLANQNLELSDVVLMIVGNKADLEGQKRVFFERPLREYKEKFDIDCWEVSAKTGMNVKALFAEMVKQMYAKDKEIQEAGFRGTIDPEEPTEPVKKARQQPGKKEQVAQVVVQQQQPRKRVEVKPSMRMTLAQEQKKRARQKNQAKKGCC